MYGLKTIFVTLLMLLLTACSVTMPKMNQPLQSAPQAIVRLDHRSKELTLVLTFSGGGTRAAALSYGVLEELRNTPVKIGDKNRRLLDEVDLISSVSGGSFTSAYYGLFGDQIFNDFEKKFLKKRVQTELLRLSLLSPKAWVRLAPAIFERSDLAAEYYSRSIFKKKTFADIRKDGPNIVINATDLSLGRGFAFTDYHFSWICSDLDSYPIGRAVAASSAVPVLFSPITLQNFSGECPYAPIIWSKKNVLNETGTRLAQTLSIRKYRDSKKYKYLHLVDGGVSDNLGIRSLLDMVAFHGDNMWKMLQTYHMTETRNMAFLVVNAASFHDLSIPKNRVVPTSAKVIDSTTTIQSDQYNVETLELLRSKFPIWQRQIREGRCKKNSLPDCAKIQFSLIKVDLHDLQQRERLQLQYVPTSLELPHSTVDKLKAAGHNLLRRSHAFRHLLQQLN